MSALRPRLNAPHTLLITPENEPPTGIIDGFHPGVHIAYEHEPHEIQPCLSKRFILGQDLAGSLNPVRVRGA
jgi:hypothetical protein